MNDDHDWLLDESDEISKGNRDSLWCITMIAYVTVIYAILRLAWGLVTG